ncbi:MAG: MFS transporter [Comamonadaceae bacterium]|jgi:MFS family permease|nr:MFS transporter [Comamonadaceae bacterium]
MTPTELRSSLSLSLIFAMRMLGLFLVLPVFALEAARLPGGDDLALVGLAMGIYGLTQGLLQIPFGMASDRFGRKRVIVFGLLVFALGSFMAMTATTLAALTLGRAVQGAGAISAAVTALLADQTRDEVRTKAMTLLGVSIGFVFALSLIVAPVLNTYIGLPGLFALTAVMALLGIAVVLKITPAEPAQLEARQKGRLALVLGNAQLMRLNLGVFVLHAVQLAMWVAIPAMLVQAGLAKDDHWQVYLPTVVASFFVLRSTLYPLERRGYLRAVFLGSVGLIGLVEVGLLWASDQAPSLSALTWLLFAFFCGFNILESCQPSMASRVAPQHARGTALGVFNTLQSMGFFVGGALGGWLVRTHGPAAVFAACTALMALWLAAAWPMRAPARHGQGSANPSPASGSAAR